MDRHRTSTLWRRQNFLPDPRLIEHLVDRAGISRADVVYDLGAGTGNLTAALARRAGRVIALERDALLVRHLRRRFAGQPNVVVCEADIRRYRFPHSDYRVFANPPFDITAAVIDALVKASAPPRDAYLVLQHEAAQRFIGRPRMALAALLIAPWFAFSVMHRFQRSDFVPAPSVDAVFLRVHKRGPPLVALADAHHFRDFAVALFTSRSPSVAERAARVFGRRTGLRLVASAGLGRDVSPSEVDLTTWLRLYNEFRQLPATIQRRTYGSEARLRRQQRRLQKSHRTRAPRDALYAALRVAAMLSN